MKLSPDSRHQMNLRAALLMTMAVIGLAAQALAQPALIPNSAVKADKIGQTIAVQGRITNIMPPRTENAPYSMYITDDVEALRIVIFHNIYGQIKNPEQFAVGSRVKVVGEVKEYRGNLEVHLLNAEGIQLYTGPAPAAATASAAAAPAASPAPAAAAVPAPANLMTIKSITVQRDGETVSIRGKAATVRPSTRPNVPTIVTVQDDTGSIDVVYWDDVGSLIAPANKPAVGVLLQVTGKVNVFRDNPQIKLEATKDIIRLPAPGAAPAAAAATPQTPMAAVAAPAIQLAGVTFTPIAKIEKGMLGQPVAVSGKITRVIPVSGGKLVEITDDLGKIMVPCWENTVGTSPFYAALKEGAAIAVQGSVDFYEQRQQIQVKLNDAAGLLSVK